MAVLNFLIDMYHVFIGILTLLNSYAFYCFIADARNQSASTKTQLDEIVKDIEKNLDKLEEDLVERTKWCSSSPRRPIRSSAISSLLLIRRFTVVVETSRSLAASLIVKQRSLSIIDARHYRKPKHVLYPSHF